MHENHQTAETGAAPEVAPETIVVSEEPLELTQEYEECEKATGAFESGEFEDPCDPEDLPSFLLPKEVFGSSEAFETFAVERAGSISAFAGALAAMKQSREIDMPEGMEPIQEAVPSPLTLKVQEMEERGETRGRIAALISAAADHSDPASFELENLVSETGTDRQNAQPRKTEIENGELLAFIDDGDAAAGDAPSQFSAKHESPVNALVRGEMPGAVSMPLRDAGLLVDVTFHIQRGSIELHQDEDGEFRVQLSVARAGLMLTDVDAELGENERSMDDLRSELSRRAAHAAELYHMKVLLENLIRP